MDNFFTSVPLFHQLYSQQCYSTGTIRKNKRDYPGDELTEQIKSKSRYESVSLYSNQLIATVWKDKSDVYFLSSHPESDAVVTTNRINESDENVEITEPKVREMYNKNRGGVDTFDQLRSQYAIGRRSNKWWVPICWWMIDACIINSYGLYRLIHSDSKMDQLHYRSVLAHELTTGFNLMKQDDDTVVASASESQSRHVLIRTEKRGDCVECSSRRRERQKEVGARSRVNSKCLFCNVYLCKSECFNKYHNILY
jgi:hypothetical protein